MPENYAMISHEKDILFFAKRISKPGMLCKAIVKYIKTVGSNLIEASINIFDSCMKQIKIFEVKVYFFRRKM